MDNEDLNKLIAEFVAERREFQAHVVRLMERQSDLEAMTEELKASNAEFKSRSGELETLTKQVAENNIRLSRIIEIHDYDIDQLDARLKRIEERRNLQ
jgi:predicted RNase H-like nuclease (RuvC/YqgF family)